MNSVCQESDELLKESMNSDCQDDSHEDNIGIVDKCINDPQLSTLNWIVFSLAMGNAADAVEICSVGFILTEIESTQREKQFLSSSIFMGMLVGGLVSGYLSDKIGRRTCLIVSLTLNAICGLFSSIVPDINWLIVLRILGGIGIGGSISIVFAVGAEVFPTLTRGKFLSIIASFWMVGAIFTSATAWIMLGSDYKGNKILPGSNWRWFAMVCAIPAIVASLLTYLCVPESPRYLIGKRQFLGASNSLNYLSNTKVNEYMLQNEGTHNSPEPIRSTIQIFKQLPFELKHSFLYLIIIWFMLSFGSYGISIWISLLFQDIGEKDVYGDSFIYALANLPGDDK